MNYRALIYALIGLMFYYVGLRLAEISMVPSVEVVSALFAALAGVFSVGIGVMLLVVSLEEISEEELTYV